VTCRYMLHSSCPRRSQANENGRQRCRFAKGDSDTQWFASLPRVEAPPPRPSSRLQSLPPGIRRPSSPAVSSPLAASPPPVDQTERLRSLLQNQQQSLSVLESEKASLTASLKRYENLESSTFGNRRGTLHFNRNTILQKPKTRRDVCGRSSLNLEY
jgi:hypothetical protein